MNEVSWKVRWDSRVSDIAPVVLQETIGAVGSNKDSVRFLLYIHLSEIKSQMY